MVKRLLLGVIATLVCTGIALGLSIQIGAFLFGWTYAGIAPLHLVVIGAINSGLVLLFDTLIRKFVLHKGDLEEISTDAEV